MSTVAIPELGGPYSYYNL